MRRAAMRVLVVDDDASIRALVRATLEDDAEVVEAADGEAALETLRAAAVDVVLLDVMMPGADGFDVLRRIRRGEAAGDVAVIMLTARAGEADHVRAFKGGADGYLTKPFTIEALRAAVLRLASLSAAERAQVRREELARAELLRQIEQRFAS